MGSLGITVWPFEILSQKMEEQKVIDAKSLQSLLFLPSFLLIHLPDNIHFLMIHLLCHASRCSLLYGHLRF
jgi:hypothetical protein